MKFFLASERYKCLLFIALLAIGGGLTVKNVIPYPHECVPNKTPEVSDLIKSEV